MTVSSSLPDPSSPSENENQSSLPLLCEFNSLLVSCLHPYNNDNSSPSSLLHESFQHSPAAALKSSPSNHQSQQQYNEKLAPHAPLESSLLYQSSSPDGNGETNNIWVHKTIKLFPNRLEMHPVVVEKGVMGPNEEGKYQNHQNQHQENGSKIMNEVPSSLFKSNNGQEDIIILPLHLLVFYENGYDTNTTNGDAGKLQQQRNQQQQQQQSFLSCHVLSSESERKEQNLHIVAAAFGICGPNMPELRRELLSILKGTGTHRHHHHHNAKMDSTAIHGKTTTETSTISSVLGSDDAIVGDYCTRKYFHYIRASGDGTTTDVSDQGRDHDDEKQQKQESIERAAGGADGVPSFSSTAPILDGFASFRKLSSATETPSTSTFPTPTPTPPTSYSLLLLQLYSHTLILRQFESLLLPRQQQQQIQTIIRIRHGDILAIQPTIFKTSSRYQQFGCIVSLRDDSREMHLIFSTKAHAVDWICALNMWRDAAVQRSVFYSDREAFIKDMTSRINQDNFTHFLPLEEALKQPSLHDSSTVTHTTPHPNSTTTSPAPPATTQLSLQHKYPSIFNQTKHSFSEQQDEMQRLMRFHQYRVNYEHQLLTAQHLESQLSYAQAFRVDDDGETNILARREFSQNVLHHGNLFMLLPLQNSAVNVSDSDSCLWVRRYFALTPSHFFIGSDEQVVKYAIPCEHIKFINMAQYQTAPSSFCMELIVSTDPPESTALRLCAQDYEDCYMWIEAIQHMIRCSVERMMKFMMDRGQQQREEALESQREEPLESVQPPSSPPSTESHNSSFTGGSDLEVSASTVAQVQSVLRMQQAYQDHEKALDSLRIGQSVFHAHSLHNTDHMHLIEQVHTITALQSQYRASQQQSVVQSKQIPAIVQVQSGLRSCLTESSSHNAASSSDELSIKPNHLPPSPEEEQILSPPHHTSSTETTSPISEADELAWWERHTTELAPSIGLHVPTTSLRLSYHMNSYKNFTRLFDQINQLDQDDGENQELELDAENENKEHEKLLSPYSSNEDLERSIGVLSSPQVDGTPFSPDSVNSSKPLLASHRKKLQGSSLSTPRSIRFQDEEKSGHDRKSNDSGWDNFLLESPQSPCHNDLEHHPNATPTPFHLRLKSKKKRSCCTIL